MAQTLSLPSPDAILPAVRVLPVVVLREISETLPLLTALSDGGLPCAEITFRTPCAPEALRLATASFPDMCIGAGTILDPEQAEEAVACGAAFIVSPGLSEEVAKVCAVADVPYIPGCVTPTEIMQALALGITLVKFFPADVYGGLAAIRALAAPFPQIRFLPTGGIGLDNIKSYLDCPAVAAVGGSFLCRGDVRANCQKLYQLL